MIGLEFVRKLCNKQIKDVAEAIGVSRQAVSSWEKGIRPIPAQRIDNLLEYFSIDELNGKDLQDETNIDKKEYLHSLYIKSKKEISDIQALIIRINKICMENPSMINVLNKQIDLFLLI